MTSVLYAPGISALRWVEPICWSLIFHCRSFVFLIKVWWTDDHENRSTSSLEYNSEHVFSIDIDSRKWEKISSFCAKGGFLSCDLKWMFYHLSIAHAPLTMRMSFVVALLIPNNITIFTITTWHNYNGKQKKIENHHRFELAWHGWNALSYCCICVVIMAEEIKC